MAGKGRPDIVAVVSQQYEEIYLFENQGNCVFTSQVIFGSTNEDFGSSGISLCDLNRDGKLDVLYTNGDGFDYAEPRLRARGSVRGPVAGKPRLVVVPLSSHRQFPRRLVARSASISTATTTPTSFALPADSMTGRIPPRFHSWPSSTMGTSKFTPVPLATSPTHLMHGRRGQTSTATASRCCSPAAFMPTRRGIGSAGCASGGTNPPLKPNRKSWFIALLAVAALVAAWVGWRCGRTSLILLVRAALPSASRGGEQTGGSRAGIGRCLGREPAFARTDRWLGEIRPTLPRQRLL